MKYLSVCMNFRNEAPYLKEWIDYHLIVGVEHFYLFNNFSDDNYLEILKPYVDKKIVSLYDIKINPPKPSVYKFCLENFAKDSEWIAFIDCDEFITPTEEDNIKNILANFEDYPGLGINWKMFGDSFHDTKPQGLVTENYLLRQDESNGFCEANHIKSIVNPRKVVPEFWNPHMFIYVPDECYPKNPLAVNENYEEIVSANDDTGKYPERNFPCFTKKVSYKKLAINHYWSKSKEEYYTRKLMKPRDDAPEMRKVDDEHYSFIRKEWNKIKDLSSYRFTEKVKNFNI